MFLLFGSNAQQIFLYPGPKFFPTPPLTYSRRTRPLSSFSFMFFTSSCSVQKQLHNETEKEKKEQRNYEEKILLQP